MSNPQYAKRLALAVVLALVAAGHLCSAIDSSFTQIDASKFPVIECFVSVTDTAGNPILNLGSGNFTVTEQSDLEGLPTTESPVDVRLLSGSGDISVALVIDRSGSMRGQEIVDAKQAAVDFVNLLQSQDRGALISFSSGITVNQTFTYDKTLLATAINAISAGGSTNMYDGIYQALQECGTVAGVRVVIVFTDGQTSTYSYSKQEVIDLANAIGVPVYTIGLGTSAAETLLQEIADATGGTYTFAPAAADLLVIYNSIAATSRDQYLVTYTTHNPDYDNTTRTVTVTVSALGGTDQDVRTYVVGANPSAPIIGSVKLWDNGTEIPWQQGSSSVAAGLALRVTAQITDDAGVQEAKLFYRQTGSGDPYVGIGMSNGVATDYEGTIPSASVKDPGVDFYVSGSDGALTTTSPPNNPATNPYQIAVLPNHSPSVVHTPVTSSPPLTAVLIQADVTDTDAGDFVDEVWLHYRESGHILFDEIEMLNAAGNAYGGTIPAAVVGTSGADYYIVAKDSHGVRSYSGSDVSPYHISITIVDGGTPIANASDITGQPQTMYPDTVYSVTCKYYHPSGRDSLKHCLLQLNHPTKPLTMMWYESTGIYGPWAGEEGANYLTITAVNVTEIANGNEGYQLTWSFQINEQWPEAQNAIDFGVFASDDADLTSGWDYYDTDASFRVGETPLDCVVHLRPQGIEASIGVIGVFEPFDIYVGASTGDIEQVRFSSDESLDGVATGEWTEEWFDWGSDTASSPWDATAKTMAWSFATGGSKEVWAEVRSTQGVLDQDYAYMLVKESEAPPVLLVHGYQNEGGFKPRELWKEMAEFLSGESIDNLEIVITGSNHFFWKLSAPASSEEKRTVYISRYSDDTSTPTCDDIRRYAQILSQEIEHIREVEATSKVDVVAHSMGGLVTRAYIEGEDFPRDLYSTQYEDDIRKFVMLGTPNHGSPLAALREFFGPLWSPCKATEQMTSGSEFLNVLNYGYETYTSDNDLISDRVDYYVIAGTLITACDQLAALYKWCDHVEGGFDGVVTSNSARLSNVGIQEYALDHWALRTADQPLKKVESLLRDVPVLIDLVYSLTYACPISLLVTDGAGRQLSTLTGINEIPGATISISPTGDIVTLYLPLQFQYEITILGEGTGTFTLVERIPIDEQEALVYFFLDIPVTASTVAHISISVSQQGQRILRIDSDSDGVIDEERTAASYRIVDGEVVPEHIVFLPDDASAVVVGPNPVTSAGTAFFYSLPAGTSISRLMIFNITGRLLFETSLDVDKSRFPSSDTWNPVDDDGVPLANGPYIYVLIADGRVIGQGKMVILRK